MSGRSKLTVRLPDESLEFVKRYAAQHGLTVTEVLSRFLTRLRESTSGMDLHPKVKQVSGLVPTEVDAEALYHERVVEKHQ
jgi:hypothetical protein